LFTGPQGGRVAVCPPELPPTCTPIGVPAFVVTCQHAVPFEIGAPVASVRFAPVIVTQPVCAKADENSSGAARRRIQKCFIARVSLRVSKRVSSFR
jgi:hypothetical protein